MPQEYFIRTESYDIVTMCLIHGKKGILGESMFLINQQNIDKSIISQYVHPCFFICEIIIWIDTF